MNTLLSRWHRKMCKPGNKAAWAIEDSLETLIRKLGERKLIDRNSPEIEQAIIDSWIAMSSATYLSRRLRQQIVEHLEFGS